MGKYAELMKLKGRITETGETYRSLRACLKSFDNREGKVDNRGKANQRGMRKRCINIQAISAGKNMR